MMPSSSQSVGGRLVKRTWIVLLVDTILVAVVGAMDVMAVDASLTTTTYQTQCSTVVDVVADDRRNSLVPTTPDQEKEELVVHNANYHRDVQCIDYVVFDASEIDCTVVEHHHHGIPTTAKMIVFVLLLLDSD